MGVLALFLPVYFFCGRRPKWSLGSTHKTLTALIFDISPTRLPPSSSTRSAKQLTTYWQWEYAQLNGGGNSPADKISIGCPKQLKGY